MTIYETIKAAISVKQAAEHYGLKANRNGMAYCPFHTDRHPSLKLNEDYFFCFGCGAKGDVIDLVARLFNLTNLQAAQKLASDFGLDPKLPTAAAMVKPKRPYIRQFREDEMLCFRVLTDYLHLLEDWKVRYAPKTPDYICGISVGMLLIIIAVEVNLLIRTGMIKGSYDTLLQEGEFTKEQKQLKKKTDTFSGVYWCLTTAIYLGWSFWSREWDFTWIIWPVAGILFAALLGIVKMIIGKKE